MGLRRISAFLVIALFLSGSAYAVSVGQLASNCGDDSKVYCKGVGYGDAMQVCLDQNYKKLAPKCQAIMDRLNAGEGVTLF